MSKKTSVILIILFCGFLGAVFALNLITPAKDFSEQENRYLSQKPSLSVKSLFSGEYTENYEKYLADQFVGRDGWVSAKTRAEYISGKRENNGIYICGDRLIKRVDEPSEALLSRNREAVKKLAASIEIPLHFTVIPGADTVLSDLLPPGAPNFGAYELTATFDSALMEVYFDSLGVLSAHADEDIYYRSDHHWTSLGAYYGYTALCAALDIEPVPLDEYEKMTVSTEFYGTSFSASGVRWTEPDAIDIYVPEAGIEVISHTEGTAFEGKLYDYSRLEAKDKYSMFLGGNQPLCVIKTEHIDLPKLLIVRDSYADSMAPFLTAHFSEIHLLDLRYYRTSVAAYIEENSIDTAVVLYGANNFATDINIFLLGM